MLPIARAAMVCLALASASQAQAAFYIADTTDGPTFNRPFADFSGLSGLATDVAYHVYSFSVETAGSYLFRSFALGARQGAGWDQYLLLYQGAFDPSMPTLNGVIGNDDFGQIGRSGFDIDLMTGVPYFLVTTGFSNEDQGRFLNLIRGPGGVTPPVPEPGTYAMLALGLLGIAFAVRRRASQRNDD